MQSGECLRVRNDELVRGDSLSNVSEHRTCWGVLVPAALYERTERRLTDMNSRSVALFGVQHHSERTATDVPHLVHLVAVRLFLADELVEQHSERVDVC